MKLLIASIYRNNDNENKNQLKNTATMSVITLGSYIYWWHVIN
jgi:hypothetical protein